MKTNLIKYIYELLNWVGVGREIMHAMWKPQKFKSIYLLATLYVLTLTLPSAASVYWAFGDMLLNHSNAFALFPRSPLRDMAVILMLIHQVGALLFKFPHPKSALTVTTHDLKRFDFFFYFFYPALHH